MAFWCPKRGTERDSGDEDAEDEGGLYGTGTRRAASPEYRVDFAAWLSVQSAALRAGRWSDLDIEHITEEPDGLGTGQRHEIRSRLIVLQWHLLKQQYQPERASKSRRNTISDQVSEIEMLLEDSPSLRREMPDFIARAYRNARAKASRETELPLATFPETPTPAFENALKLALAGEDFTI